ncbi:MAG TPA: rod shape-determining protein MreC [Rhodobacteraceae bacterium]|jgi:rod shape-determining protein MreC|nr:rod shape-determining protein MreC [Paracoccaceae bacterium]HBG99265.1 rod shape-determining protein MreC [Paracoccaceae bacterium]
MARDSQSDADFVRPARRVLLGALALALVALVVVWRIDSPRVERFRAAVIDRVVPPMDWAMAPVTGLARMAGDFQSYAQLHRQNRELRRELQQMRAWREAALQLEQENAKLRDLNNVRISPELTWITGVVMADSGNAFRQTVLLNVGRRDGVRNGWAVTDGLGLVGRISEQAERSARVLLLTDTNSLIAVSVQPSGQRALLTGDNTARPRLTLLEAPEAARPGDRVVTSGDDGVMPAGLVVGELVEDRDGRPRVRLAADYARLEFLRVLRSPGIEAIDGPSPLVAGPATPRADAADAAIAPDDDGG